MRRAAAPVNVVGAFSPRLPLPLIHVLPDFVGELDRVLRAGDADDLADQVRGLSITAVCSCGDDFCSSFYTGPRPNGPWGQTHRNVSPEVATGMIVLDVVDDRIRYVEVLHRADVKQIIATLVD